MAQSVFDVIKQEHKEIRGLLSKAQDDPSQFPAFVKELKSHVAAEEATFYRPLKEEQQTHELIMEGFEEHHVVDLIISELQRNQVGTDQWNAKFKVMTENLEHHIEEEEGELFSAASSVVNEQRATQMARDFKQAEGQAS